MVMLGALLTLQNVVSFDSVQQAFLKVFGERKKDFLPSNEKALNAGRDASKRFGFLNKFKIIKIIASVL